MTGNNKRKPKPTGDRQSLRTAPESELIQQQNANAEDKPASKIAKFLAILIPRNLKRVARKTKTAKTQPTNKQDTQTQEKRKQQKQTPERQQLRNLIGEINERNESCDSGMGASGKMNRNFKNRSREKGTRDSDLANTELRQYGSCQKQDGSASKHQRRRQI